MSRGRRRKAPPAPVVVDDVLGEVEVIPQDHYDAHVLLGAPPSIADSPELVLQWARSRERPSGLLALGGGPPLRPPSGSLRPLGGAHGRGEAHRRPPRGRLARLPSRRSRAGPASRSATRESARPSGGRPRRGLTEPEPQGPGRGRAPGALALVSEAGRLHRPPSAPLDLPQPPDPHPTEDDLVKHDRLLAALMGQPPGSRRGRRAPPADALAREPSPGGAPVPDGTRRGWPMRAARRRSCHEVVLGRVKVRRLREVQRRRRGAVYRPASETRASAPGARPRRGPWGSGSVRPRRGRPPGGRAGSRVALRDAGQARERRDGRHGSLPRAGRRCASPRR